MSAESAKVGDCLTLGYSEADRARISHDDADTDGHKKEHAFIHDLMIQSQHDSSVHRTKSVPSMLYQQRSTALEV